MLQALRSKITEDLTGEFIRSIEARYSTALQMSAVLVQLRSQCEATKARLRDEIYALGRRGNLNLVIGSLTTVFAAGLLAFIVLNTEVRVENWTSILPSITLRLSLVVFIEIFSFFFLRLYKASLHEIKYFQNELTNVEAKFIAMETSLAAGNAQAVNAIIRGLGRTERNFILKKGETTVEIERIRSDTYPVKELIEPIRQVVAETTKSKKPG